MFIAQVGFPGEGVEFEGIWRRKELEVTMVMLWEGERRKRVAMVMLCMYGRQYIELMLQTMVHMYHVSYVQAVCSLRWNVHTYIHTCTCIYKNYTH